MRKFAFALVALTTTAAGSAVGAEDFVAAGTQLRPGETAIVPHLVPNGPQVPIELEIVSIEEGAVADLGDFDVPAELGEARPYYVRYQYKNLSEEDLSFQQVGAFVAIDQQGDAVMPAFTMGGETPLPQCPTEVVGDLGPGDSHQSCVMFMIGEGETLTSVGYRGNYRHTEGVDTEAEFPIYYDPVLWLANADNEKARGKLVAPQG